MRKVLFALKIIWGVSCVFLLTIDIMDLISFNSNPSKYPIGWEGGGWSYASYSNYNLSGYIFAFWYMMGLLPWLFHKRKSATYFFAAHFILSILSLLWFWHLILTNQTG